MDQAAAFQRRYLRDLEYGATDDIDAVALDECEPPATVQRVVAGWRRGWRSELQRLATGF